MFEQPNQDKSSQNFKLTNEKTCLQNFGYQYNFLVQLPLLSPPWPAPFDVDFVNPCGKETTKSYSNCFNKEVKNE